MSAYNPYEAPNAAHSVSGFAPTTGQPVTLQTIEALRATKPWVRLLGVMGFIAAAFMVLGGLAIGVAGAVGPSNANSNIQPFLAPIYIVLAVVYVYPSLQLTRYATAIDQLLADGTVQSLEIALEKQRAFWRFAGILALAMIGLCILAFLAGIVGGIIMAAGQH